MARALAAGTPQLVLPIAYDQLDNADRVERLGAGEWIRARRAGSRRIARALSRLTGPAVQERCRALAAEFGRGDGLDVAADRVEEFARRSAVSTRLSAGSAPGS